MLGEIRREVTSAIFDYDVPDFEHESASPELGEMIEARLVDAFAGGDDGLDDGTLLAKDADGIDNDLVMTTQNTREGTPGEGNPIRPATARRAERSGGSRSDGKAPMRLHRGFLVHAVVCQ